MIDDDDIIIPFGKYKGSRLGDVPASYLLYIAKFDWLYKFQDIKDYIENNWEQLNNEAHEEGQL